MMHGSLGGANAPYGYSQDFGTPGGVQNSNINGYQIGGPVPAQRGQRSRSTSNVGMQPPQQYQNPAGSIPGWARGVQAAQSSDDRQPPSNEQQYSQYDSAPIQTLGSMSVPQDPGPCPNLADLKLTKKQAKKVMDNWQKAHDEWSLFQSQQQKGAGRTRGRSRSQTRFAQDPMGNSSGYAMNSVPYPTADSTSDLDSRMSRLAMSGLKPQGMQNDAAAARNAERGRRLSGGALGLSGSEAQAARDRSRSRQPYDTRQSYDRSRPVSGDYGSARPAYMPSGRGYAPGVDPGLQHVSQPGVVPMSQSGVHPSGRVANIAQYSQPSHSQSSHTPAVNPYGLPSQPSYSQSSHTPAVNPYGLPPQPSPLMQGQQIPQVTGGQYGPQPSPQFVTMTMMNGQTTSAIPVGHVSQYSPIAAMLNVPPSTVPATLDLKNLPPGVVFGGGISPGGASLGGMMSTASYPSTTPNMALYSLPYQTEPQQQTRRKTNINDLSHPRLGDPQPHKPNTLINTTTTAPRHHTTTNISNYTSSQPPVQPQMQSQMQPQMHSQTQPQMQSQAQAQAQTLPPTRGHHKSHSVSGYVSAAPTQQAEILSPTDTASSGSSRGANTSSFQTMNSYQTYSSGTARPPMRHNESAGLSQPTGPSGFGTRPHHVKHPSYQDQLRSPPNSNGSSSNNSDIPRVTRRPPGPNAKYVPFSPQVITYDLNGEHRQPDPLRFGRFIYDRDVTHEEWDLFRSQILEKWAARDRGFNRYHSAVKRVTAILSAWNFAFFNPRGMDVVLFKGNERRSGPNFGQPEGQLDFLTEATPVSESESEDSEDESDEEDVALQNWVGPQADAYRRQREQEKAAKAAYKRNTKQRAPQQLESPHSLVIYPVSMRNPAAGESYR